MIKCQKALYDWHKADVNFFRKVLDDALQANGGKKLKSIAFGCHGPPPDANGEPGEEAFYWPITESIVVRDDSELHDASNPARQLVEMLGHSVEHAPETRGPAACSL